jgi:hypothetical protein
MSAAEYNLHGRRLASRFPCPKWRQPATLAKKKRTPPPRHGPLPEITQALPCYLVPCYTFLSPSATTP